MLSFYLQLAYTLTELYVLHHVIAPQRVSKASLKEHGVYDDVR